MLVATLVPEIGLARSCCYFSAEPAISILMPPVQSGYAGEVVELLPAQQAAFNFSDVSFYLDTKIGPRAWDLTGIKQGEVQLRTRGQLHHQVQTNLEGQSYITYKVLMPAILMQFGSSVCNSKMKLSCWAPTRLSAYRPSE